jgi:hypothetical protein
MTELIAVLSTGQGTWAEVAALIKGQPWEKVFLVTNEFGKRFVLPQNGEMIVVNPDMSIVALQNDIVQKLRGKINGLEVALNIVSGSGKEHMAVVGALIKLGVGFRLVAMTEKGFQEI